MGQIDGKFESRNKERTRYITSINPQSVYANQILDNSHEYEPISITTALLQSAHKGGRMHMLENHFIQLFQHNNTIVNELLNLCTIYSHVTHAPTNTPHTPSTTYLHPTLQTRIEHFPL
jgi:hypothetical protein